MKGNVLKILWDQFVLYDRVTERWIWEWHDMLLLIGMMMMIMMMMMMVKVDISARWFKNTEKALVVQLRSAEQEFQIAAGDWEEKQVCFVFSYIPWTDSSLPVQPAAPAITVNSHCANACVVVVCTGMGGKATWEQLEGSFISVHLKIKTKTFCLCPAVICYLKPKDTPTPG